MVGSLLHQAVGNIVSDSREDWKNGYLALEEDLEEKEEQLNTKESEIEALKAALAAEQLKSRVLSQRLWFAKSKNAALTGQVAWWRAEAEGWKALGVALQADVQTEVMPGS